MYEEKKIETDWPCDRRCESVTLKSIRFCRTVSLPYKVIYVLLVKSDSAAVYTVYNIVFVQTFDQVNRFDLSHSLDGYVGYFEHVKA